MTSNNETVSAKCHERATLQKLDVKRKTVHCYPRNVDAVERDRRWPDVAGISVRFSKFAFVLYCDITNHLKVKCNEIWTIFLLLKILYKNISHTNRKQNQLSKLGFAQTVALKIRKSDGFREFYENEPEMAAPRLETKIRYLWRHVWWACFHEQKRLWGFREIIEFVSRIFWMKSIDSPMFKRDEDINLWSGNVQTQPWKFEPLESDKDSAKITLSGSGS